MASSSSVEPINDAAAAGIAPGEPVSLQVAFSDPSIFLENAHWFKLLQDDGKEMTPDEISVVYQEPPKGNKPKKK